MKFAEINKKFTETVTEWISKGYTINTATMRGSEGEISKIDLTDGKEIIRILLDRNHSGTERIGDRFYSLDAIRLIVGRDTDGAIPNDQNDLKTVWNNHLDVISCEEFYEIGREKRDGTKWYGTREEAIAQQNKAWDRLGNRNTEAVTILDATAIVIPFVKRQPKCKTIRANDIVAVKKTVRTDRRKTSVKYTVETNRGTFELH